MPGFNKGIKLGSTYGKVVGNIVGYLYGITLGIDVITYQRSLEGSFDDSNDNKIEGLVLNDSLGYTDGKVLESDK